MIIFCLVMGTLVAFTARHEVLEIGGSWMGLHLMGVAVTGLTVMVPLGAYLFIVYPAWSTLYLFDSSSLTFWHILGSLLALPVAGALGYFIGVSFCRWFGLFASIAVVIIALVALVALILWFPDELFHISDGAQWKDAPSLFSGDLLAVFAFSLPLVLGGWLFIFTLFEVEGRKLVRASRVVAESASNPASSFSPPISVKVPSSMEKSFFVPDLTADNEGEEKSPENDSPSKVSAGDPDKPPLSSPGPEKA